MFKYDNPTTKTFEPATLKAMEGELYKLLDEYSIESFPAGHRNHLGVSVIGEKCARKLWYGFRWVKLEHFEGRMRRLFNRGHSEEEKFKNILTWMGFFVREIDPNTNKQYKFSVLNGHYGGSGDSIALLPWFRSDDDIRILVEYKTSNKRLFEALKKDGVKIAQPKHWAQMCGYALEFQVKYGLYCAINKDNDDIHFELLELDWNYAQQLKNKATDIITAKLPPPRISDNPAWFDCKYCDKAGICHHNEPVEINCRSCRFATAIEGAEWHCEMYKLTIPKNMIAKGCDSHVSINN